MQTWPWQSKVISFFTEAIGPTRMLMRLPVVVTASAIRDAGASSQLIAPSDPARRRLQQVDFTTFLGRCATLPVKIPIISHQI
jgi:hypothetical protein